MAATRAAEVDVHGAVLDVASLYRDRLPAQAACPQSARHLYPAIPVAIPLRPAPRSREMKPARPPGVRSEPRSARENDSTPWCCPPNSPQTRRPTDPPRPIDSTPSSAIIGEQCQSEPQSASTLHKQTARAAGNLPNVPGRKPPGFGTERRPHHRPLFAVWRPVPGTQLRPLARSLVNKAGRSGVIPNA